MPERDWNGVNKAKTVKIRIVLILGVFIGMVCCQTDIYEYKSKGQITGPDVGMCICCGGWKIIIDGETYNFNSLPGSSNIDLQKETFPVNVKLDWVSSTQTGCPKWIDIINIIKE